MKSSLYITPNPDIPIFMYKRYTKSSVQQLIEWSKKEYNDTLRLYAKRGDFRSVLFLHQNCSAMYLLAKMKGFRAIVAALASSPEIWNQLSLRERAFLRRAYELYETLRPTN